MSLISGWCGRAIWQPYTGVTRYVQNSDGLIFKHLETWDTSIIDVFLSESSTCSSPPYLHVMLFMCAILVPLHWPVCLACAA